MLLLLKKWSTYNFPVLKIKKAISKMRRLLLFICIIVIIQAYKSLSALLYG